MKGADVCAPDTRHDLADAWLVMGRDAQMDVVRHADIGVHSAVMALASGSQLSEGASIIVLSLIHLHSRVMGILEHPAPYGNIIFGKRLSLSNSREGWGSGAVNHSSSQGVFDASVESEFDP